MYIYVLNFLILFIFKFGLFLKIIHAFNLILMAILAFNLLFCIIIFLFQTIGSHHAHGCDNYIIKWVLYLYDK